MHPLQPLNSVGFSSAGHSQPRDDFPLQTPVVLPPWGNPGTFSVPLFFSFPSQSSVQSHFILFIPIPGKEITLLMQTLNTLSTSEEKLAALCKKYAELVSPGAGGGCGSSEEQERPLRGTFQGHTGALWCPGISAVLCVWGGEGGCCWVRPGGVCEAWTGGILANLGAGRARICFQITFNQSQFWAQGELQAQIRNWRSFGAACACPKYPWVTFPCAGGTRRSFRLQQDGN